MISLGIDPASKNIGVAIVENGMLKYSEQKKLASKGTTSTLAAGLVEFSGILTQIIVLYKPDIVIVEHTSVPRNLNTTKVLSYFEGIALYVARMQDKRVERVRTTSARKSVFGKGNIKKDKVISAVRTWYGEEIGDDEAEAIVFAYHGLNILKGEVNE